MSYIPDESLPLIDKLRMALIGLDAIEDTLKEMIDFNVQNDSATFQIRNVDRIRMFINRELHRREIDLLERWD